MPPPGGGGTVFAFDRVAALWYPSRRGGAGRGDVGRAGACPAAAHSGGASGAHLPRPGDGPRPGGVPRRRLGAHGSGRPDARLRQEHARGGTPRPGPALRAALGPGGGAGPGTDAACARGGAAAAAGRADH